MMLANESVLYHGCKDVDMTEYMDTWRKSLQKRDREEDGGEHAENSIDDVRFRTE